MSFWKTKMRNIINKTSFKRVVKLDLNLLLLEVRHGYLMGNVIANIHENMCLEESITFKRQSVIDLDQINAQFRN